MPWLRLKLATGVAVVGTAITVLLCVHILRAEKAAARADFRDDFHFLSQSIHLRVAETVRATCAMADALGTHPALPTTKSVHQIVQMYADIFSPGPLGVALVARVSNSPAAVAAWAGSASERLGLPVTPTVPGGATAAAHPYAWMVQDAYPAAEAAGYVLSPGGVESVSNKHSNSSASDLVQLLLASLGTPATHTPINTLNRTVVVSGLALVGAAPSEPVAIILTPVSFESQTNSSDTDVLLMTGVAPVSSLFDSIWTEMKDTEAVITDQFGVSWRFGDCGNLTGSKWLQRLTGPIFFAGSAQWTLQLSQCDSYWSQFSAMELPVLAATCATLTVFATVLCVCVLSRVHSSKLQSEERARAHQLIVGYICHELRNPLHILRTAQSSLVEWAAKHCPGLRPHLPKARRGEEEERLTEDEVVDLVLDARAALTVMQTTLNEVLDLGAIESGINSLRMTPVPLVLRERARRMLMRCRAFVHPAVPLKLRLVLSDPDLIVCVDKNKMAQILTNGISNAGKFTSGGEIVVTIAVITRLSALTLMSVGSGQRNLISGGSTGSVEEVNALKVTSAQDPSLQAQQAQQVANPTVSKDAGAQRPGTGDNQAYLCVTISNTRCGEAIQNPDGCFIPFKRTTKGVSAWRPTTASDSHKSGMKKLWLASLKQAVSVSGELMPPLHGHTTGPVKASTGLGLPLCRGFAHSAGGWLALDEAQADGMTHLWCVLPVTVGDALATPVVGEPHLSVTSSRTVSNPTVRDHYHGMDSDSKLPEAQAAAPLRLPLAPAPIRALSTSRPEPVTTGSRPVGGAPAPMMISGEHRARITLPVAPAHSPRQARSVGQDSDSSATVMPFLTPPAGFTRTSSTEAHEPGPAFLVPSTAGRRYSKESSKVLPETPLMAESELCTPLPGALTMASPRKQIYGQVPRPTTSSAFYDLRVFFVDDELSNTRVGLRFLKGLGVQSANITTLSDGTDALSVLAAHCSDQTAISHASTSAQSFVTGTPMGTPFTPLGDGDSARSSLRAHKPSPQTVMLLDIFMPGKCGTDVMRELLAHGVAPFPVIAMTGNVDTGSVASYRSLGFAGCLGKPFDRRGLKAALASALKGEWFTIISEGE